MSADGTAVRCDGVPTSFSVGGALVPGRYAVALAFSWDLQQLLWEQPLDYFPAPQLLDVVPATVRQSQAVRVLSIAAAGLLEDAGGARCRLEPSSGSGSQGAAYFASSVIYLSSSALECTFGAVPNGAYVVSLASNGV